MSQPHFEGSVRSPLTLPKMGLESPLGLPKTQSSIAGIKKPRLEVFFIPLERSWSVDVQNGLAWTIWTFVTQWWSKEGPGVKLAVWLPATKSRKSTRSRCMQVECDTPLESSPGELQVCFRPHPNRRSELGVMNAQSPGSPSQDSFGTPLWESRDKKPFVCSLRRVTQSILYGGRWWLPPSPGRGESSESVLPVTRPNTKNDPKCGLTTLWLVLMQVRISE
jgi:hypothetical protein